MFVTECINSHTDQLNERDVHVSVGEYHGYWPADSQSSVCLPQSSSSANRIEPALGKETRLDCCDSPVCFSWSPCLPAHKHSEPLPWCCWQYKSHALEAHQGWFTGLLTFFYCRTCHSEKSVNQAHCPNESTHTHTLTSQHTVNQRVSSERPDLCEEPQSRLLLFLLHLFSFWWCCRM